MGGISGNFASIRDIGSFPFNLRLESFCTWACTEIELLVWDGLVRVDCNTGFGKEARGGIQDAILKLNVPAIFY